MGVVHQKVVIQNSPPMQLQHIPHENTDQQYRSVYSSNPFPCYVVAPDVVLLQILAKHKSVVDAAIPIEKYLEN